MPKFLDDNGLLYFWQKIKSKFLTNVAYDSTNKKLTKTVSGTTSDIVTVSTLKTALSLSKSDFGLGNVDNTSDANKPISTATQAALDDKAHSLHKHGNISSDGAFTTSAVTTVGNGDWLVISDASDDSKIKKSYIVFDAATGDKALTKKGTFESFVTSSALSTRLSSYVPNSRAVNGHALTGSITLTASDVGACPLNDTGKIDATYLPSYVDDVIEAYARSGQTALSSTWLATGSASGTVITPESGKIYVLMADSGNYVANTQFRWSGTSYVKLNDGGVSAITNSEIDTILAA